MKIKQVLNEIKLKNSNEPEFMQSVEETFLSLENFLQENPKYLENNLLHRITEPERIISFRVTWQDDLGNTQINRGYRVQFNSAIGPYKGGLRFHPTVNLSILKFLGFEQTFKNSLTGLPLGGGKGGSDFDPKGKSDNEIMRFCQAFISELYKFIGPTQDIPAGDIGVGAKELGYMFGYYKKLTDQFDGALTGKGSNWGGSFLRPEATGYGLVYFAENILNTNSDSIKNKKILISGSGNVAQYAAQKSIELKAKVLTMSDSDGVIYDKDGISQEKLNFIKDLKNNKRGRISEYISKYKKAEYYPNKNPWGLKADIALPCATQNEIDIKDAKLFVKNKIKLVAEGANMPTTNEAIKIIQNEKISFAPSKAANAGGVAVSGLEMSQNSMHLQWTESEIDKKLKDIMKNIHSKCLANGNTKKSNYVDYLKGANIAGFTKVADSMIDQGIL